MRRLLLIVLAVLLLPVATFGAFLALRPAAAQPRYPQIEFGMSWEKVEEILGAPHLTYLWHGRLCKDYVDVDGRTTVTYDVDTVAEVVYVPDNPNPDFWVRVSKWLRW